jgi:hypothetical protein
MDSGSAPRVMARQLARTLTDAELNLVAGGGKDKPPVGDCSTGTGCFPYGCADIDCK